LAPLGQTRRVFETPSLILSFLIIFLLKSNMKNGNL